MGGAHAGATDQLAGVAAAGGSADSTDLLIIASANLVQAKGAITGVETADLSDAVLSLVEAMHPMSNGLDRFALDAVHALDAAAEYDSISGAFSADFRMLGIGYFQIIPTALASMPIMWITDLIDEAVPVSDIFHFWA